MYSSLQPLPKTMRKLVKTAYHTKVSMLTYPAKMVTGDFFET